MFSGKKFVVSSLCLILLSGCGGGGGGGSTANNGSGTSGTTTLNGVAAVGTPIVNGTIDVICAAGSAFAPTSTSDSGAWQVTLSVQTLPCAVEVSGGTINGATNVTTYHSRGMVHIVLSET